MNATKTATDVNGGNVSRDDRLDYSITVTNDGDSPADSTGLIDAIPFGTTYVPGSLKIGGTGVSDAAGDDEGEVVAANSSPAWAAMRPTRPAGDSWAASLRR